MPLAASFRSFWMSESATSSSARRRANSASLAFCFPSFPAAKANSLRADGGQNPRFKAAGNIVLHPRLVKAATEIQKMLNYIGISTACRTERDMAKAACGNRLKIWFGESNDVVFEKHGVPASPLGLSGAADLAQRTS
ncbi:MAG: hypothetical protein WCC66_08620, partial [Rhizobiaceae bacterium]